MAALPSLRQLRTFLAAVETGSVSAAARGLNLTQPAASQQLRELERALGVRLLDRAGGRLIPTAAGAAVLEPARRAQDAVDDAIAAVSGFRTGKTGRVRLGTGATACIHLLPPVLAALRARMPGLDVAIATGNTPDVLRRVEAGELDIALVTMPEAVGRALTGTRLLVDPLRALVPAAMAPAVGAIGPAELARLPLILYEAGGKTRGVVDAWFRAAGLVPRPIMELGSVEAIKVMVGSGLGASILPALALAEPVTGARSLDLRPKAARALGYVLRRGKVLDRGLRLVIEELERAGRA